MNKKALSMVISVMIFILLTLALVGIIWATITNLTETNIDQSESCFQISDKVTINKNQYTCYNSDDNYISLSISNTDANLDSIFISISKESEEKSFELVDGKTYSYVKNINNPNENIQLPGQNSGKTYKIFLSDTYFGFSTETENTYSIKLLPKVNENNCGVSDSYLDIPDCREFQ